MSRRSRLLLAAALYAWAFWQLTACSTCSNARPGAEADGGDTESAEDGGADGGADAGEEDGGTFVPPGPFALEWVVCLDDLAFAFQDWGYRVAVLGDGRISAAGQVNYPTFSSFLTVFEEDGEVAWSAEYTPTISANASQIIGSSVVETETGDVVVTGGMNGTVLLEVGDGSTVQLESDVWAFFLARYTSGGSLKWAFRVDAPTQSGGWGVVSAPSDGVVVTGDIDGQTVFGIDEPNETFLSSKGAFVARYDADGMLLWAKGTTGKMAVGRGAALAEDEGEVVQIGDFPGYDSEETVTFGAGEANETTITPVVNSDIFVARYAIEDGALQWAARAGSKDSVEVENGWDAAISGSDTVLVGQCQEDAEFGDLVLGSEYGTGFMAASAPDGSFSWVKGIGGYGAAEAHCVASDPEGLYVAGDLMGGTTAIFGEGEAAETSFTLPVWDNYYGFIARYGFDGALEWVGIIPTVDVSCTIFPYGIAVASEDEFVISGEYRNDEGLDLAMFGWDEDGNPVTCDGDHDHPFVAKYRVQ